MSSLHLLTLALTVVLLSVTLNPVFSFSFNGNKITDLEGNDAGFIADSALWTARLTTSPPPTATQIYSACDTTYLLGGYGYIKEDVTFYRKYSNLPPHNIIYFSFYVSLIDQWLNNSTFVFLFDDQSFAAGVFLLNYDPNFAVDTCGDPAVKDLAKIKIYGKTKHVGESLNLKVMTITHTDPSLRSFGFREVTLLFRNSTAEEKAQQLTFQHMAQEMCGHATIPLPLGQCTCNEGKYVSPADGTCQLCHPLCKTCLGPSASQCLDCQSQAFFNGKECTACHSSCATCSGSSKNECLSCASNYYMFEGNSCLDSCNAPLVPSIVGTDKYCSFPCPSTQYLYSDGSCKSTCPSTFNTIAFGNGKFCSHYCPAGQFYIPPLGSASGACLASCPQGYFVDTVAAYCVPCQDSLCSSCPTNNGATCQACKVGSILDSDGICKECISMSVTYLKTLDVGHRYLVETLPKACSLQAATLQQSLVGTLQPDDPFPSYSFRVASQNDNQYMVDILLDGSVMKKTDIALQLFYINSAMVVPKTLVPSPELQEAAAYTSTAQTVLTSTMAVGFTGAIALGSTAAVWSIVGFQQFVGYFIFINVEFPFQVKMFFSMLGASIWDLVPNPLLSLTKSLSKSMINSEEFSNLENQPPEKFVENDMNSDFIENGGEIIFINMALLGLLVLIGFLRRMEKLRKNSIVKTIQNSLRWNIIARAYLENCIPLMLAILLQLRSLDFEYTYLVVGSLFSLLSLIYCIVVFYWLMKVLYKSNISELKKETSKKVYGTLFEGIALEGPKSKYYHIIILLRGVLLMFLIVFLEDMPILQIIPLIVYNAGLIYYLLKEARFEDKYLNMINRGKEVLILIGEMFILGLNFKDGGEQHYNTLGWLIVACFVSALLVETTYMMGVQIMEIKTIISKVVTFYNFVRDWIKNKDARKRQKKRRDRTRRVSPQKCEEDITMMNVDINEKTSLSFPTQEKTVTEVTGV